MKLWTNKEESLELLNIIEKSKKEGNTINTGCELFCLKYPKYSTKQARARYYQLINSEGDIKEEIIVQPWTEQEEEKLLTYCEENLKKGVSKTKIFLDLSKEFNRTFNSVSGRYYILKNNKNKNEKKKKINIEQFISQISNIDLNELNLVIDKLLKFQNNLKNDDKEILIMRLQNNNDILETQNLILLKELDKKEKEIKNLNHIIDKYKNKYE